MKKLVILSILALAFITATPKADAMTSCDTGWNFFLVNAHGAPIPMASCGASAYRVGWIDYLAGIMSVD